MHQRLVIVPIAASASSTSGQWVSGFVVGSLRRCWRLPPLRAHGSCSDAARSGVPSGNVVAQSANALRQDGKDLLRDIAREPIPVRVAPHRDQPLYCTISAKACSLFPRPNLSKRVVACA